MDSARNDQSPMDINQSNNILILIIIRI
jgi:hypothetical protein